MVTLSLLHILVLFLYTFHLSPLCTSYEKNLLSFSEFYQNNKAWVEFWPCSFLMKDLQTWTIFLRGPLIGGTYEWLASSTCSQPLTVTFSSVKTSLQDWHHRLWHPSYRILHQIIFTSSLPIFLFRKFHCNSCLSNKSHKLPFGTFSMSSSSPLQLIYSDEGDQPI